MAVIPERVTEGTWRQLWVYVIVFQGTAVVQTLIVMTDAALPPNL